MTIRNEEAELAQRMRDLQRLHAGLAHDLRGPLNVLTLNLDLLATSLDGSAEERELKYLGSLRRELGGLHAALERVLAMFRPWTDEITRFDARELLDAAVELLSRPSKRRRVELTARTPPTAVPLTGQRDALFHAILALTWAGLDQAADGSRLELGVHEAADLAQFEWRSSEPSGSPLQGARSALSVADAIVTAHGGRLSFPDTADPVATVTLPVANRSGSA